MNPDQIPAWHVWHSWSRWIDAPGGAQETDSKLPVLLQERRCVLCNRCERRAVRYQLFL